MERSEAKRLGLTAYFTGIPCKRGHVAERSTVNHSCRECVNDRLRQQRAADPHPFRAADKRRREKDPAAYSAGQRARRLRNIEKRRAYDHERYHNNPERKDWQKKQALGWAKTNKGKRVAIIAARRAAQKQATPPWLTKAQKKEIRAFYIEAARRPGEWHVDHIYPIKGKNSCGLHVPWNLQILPGDENRRKGNKVHDAE